jgi:glycosyltransferase involved in cell wall biosynthesis
MAAGLPVVATDVGGVSELIDSGRNGFLVPARQPQMLAQAIVMFQRLPLAEKKKLMQAARECVEEKFNCNKEAQTLKKLFADIVSGKTC